MQSVAQSWLVYRLTASASLLGLVGFVGQIPVFALAALGGVAADRRSLQPILVATQVASMLLAFTLAGLTLSGLVRVWEVFALAALVGLVNAFDIPARQAFVVEMVGREDLPNAIALNSVVVNGARIVGPSAAGLLVAAVGEGWCFFLNALSYAAVVAGLLLMRVAPRASEVGRGRSLSNLTEGFTFAWRHGPVRAVLMLLGLTSIAGVPYVVLMPLFADRVFRGGPRALGFLLGAAGAGALAGALIAASRRGLSGLGRRIALASASFGVCLVLFSLSRSFWLSVALLLPAGCSWMLQLTASNTYVQSVVPDHLRGRVMAVYSMMFMGMTPFGALAAGSLAERFGAPATVGAGGLACAAGAALFATRLKSLRRESESHSQVEEVTDVQPTD
jgi:MFS family permease